ncbi:MAG: hypothetical protein PGN13_09070 [Patulibacter minatonensis]
MLSAFGGWLIVLLLHERAGIVGMGWMLAGVVLYLVSRSRSHLPLRQAVVVPKTVLSRDTTHGEFGSILVPVFGRKLDDDIVQTAGRLARDRTLDLEESGGAQIEAIWVFEIPMSLPLASGIDDDRLKLARKALARAKAVGEEYEGLTVATATVRARRAGQGIVDEARRRGVDDDRHGRRGALAGARRLALRRQRRLLRPRPRTDHDLRDGPTRRAACSSRLRRWAIAPSPTTTPRTSSPPVPPWFSGAAPCVRAQGGGFPGHRGTPCRREE